MSGVGLSDCLGQRRRARRWPPPGHEAAFREEVLLALVAIPLALYFGQNGVERALLIGNMFLILIVEILNSALKPSWTKASPEKHELAKRAKDMSGAAVLLALSNAAVVWICVLWPTAA